MTQPTDILSFVRKYLIRHGLEAEIIVLGQRSERESGLEFSITPKKSGAVGISVLVTPLPGDRYEIDIFLGSDDTPIEISGPINVNRQGNHLALDELADVLDSVCNGEVYEELDNGGQSLGFNIWDPERPLGSDNVEAARRRTFAAWS